MIVIVRMRGEVKTRRDVLDTFKILGLKKVYSATIVEETPIVMGMVKKVQNFVAWGEASEETVQAIGKTRGLKTPKGGIRSKKVHYPRGNLGYCGDKINDMIKRML